MPEHNASGSSRQDSAASTSWFEPPSIISTPNIATFKRMKAQTAGAPETRRGTVLRARIAPVTSRVRSLSPVGERGAASATWARRRSIERRRTASRVSRRSRLSRSQATCTPFQLGVASQNVLIGRACAGDQPPTASRGCSSFGKGQQVHPEMRNGRSIVRRLQLSARDAGKDETISASVSPRARNRARERRDARSRNSARQHCPGQTSSVRARCARWRSGRRVISSRSMAS